MQVLPGLLNGISVVPCHIYTRLVALRLYAVISAFSFALALVSTSWSAKMTDVTTRTLQHWRHVAKYVMLVLIASRTCVRLLSLLHPNLDHMLTPASR
jgi:hypothetical protein